MDLQRHADKVLTAVSRWRRHRLELMARQRPQGLRCTGAPQSKLTAQFSDFVTDTPQFNEHGSVKAWTCLVCASS
jgi:hypothetical protein